MPVRTSLGAAVVLAAAVTLTLACSSSRAPAPGSAASSAQIPWQRTALWVEREGTTQPFENGATVTVGEVNVEVFLAPFPPEREGSIDFYITDKATGRPISGGSVDISLDMFMPHGTIKAEALQMSDGHYLVPYKLVMPGEWRVDVTIAQRREVVALGFIFRVE